MAGKCNVTGLACTDCVPGPCEHRSTPVPEAPSGGLNYEAEYHRMLEITEKLKCEIKDKNYQIERLIDEHSRMKAQLDIVYLIFGRK